MTLIQQNNSSNKKTNHQNHNSKNQDFLHGENQIFLRLTFNRKSKYYVLKGEQETLSCEFKKWNAELGRYKRSRELNHFLEAYEYRANKVKGIGV